eukprot:2384655-Prymnesium_polylepis.1
MRGSRLGFASPEPLPGPPATRPRSVPTREAHGAARRSPPPPAWPPRGARRVRARTFGNSVRPQNLPRGHVPNTPSLCFFVYQRGSGGGRGYRLCYRAPAEGPSHLS